jgi:hypothetical protein
VPEAEYVDAIVRSRWPAEKPEKTD